MASPLKTIKTTKMIFKKNAGKKIITGENLGRLIEALGGEPSNFYNKNTMKGSIPLNPEGKISVTSEKKGLYLNLEITTKEAYIDNTSWGDMFGGDMHPRVAIIKEKHTLTGKIPYENLESAKQQTP